MSDLKDRPTDQKDRVYRLLVESITDYAIYLLDPSGIVSSWNPGAQRFKGYQPAEIIGQNFSRFYTPEDQATNLPQRALAEASEKGVFQGEGWRVRKDGTRFWASVVIDAIRGPNGKIIGFAKITRDLTERRQRDQALRKSEEQFRVLVQGVSDYAIYMLDTGGMVTSWNPGAERIKGYRPEEIIGQHFSRFYTDEDRRMGEPQIALETALREGRYEKEATRIRKDGTPFNAHVVIDPVRDEDGRLIGFAKITRDVTSRNLAMAIQASEWQFRSFSQSMPNQVWAADIHGKLDWFSEKTLAYIGLAYGELAGDGWAQAVHPDDLARVAPLWAAALASGVLYETEFRIRRHDGAYRWHLVRAAPIRDDQGKIVRWIGTNTDIEERKRAVEQQALLLGELNHRVKNLFALVGGIVALSARSATTAQELAGVLRGRLGALAQAHELIQPGLLSGDAAGQETLDLRALISQIFAPYTSAQSQSRIHLEGPQISLTGQVATSMALIFHELATNAAKYGALKEESGQVRVIWRIQGEAIQLRWEERGGPPISQTPQTTGFGNKLLQNTIVGQLHGSVAFAWPASGAIVDIVLPVASVSV